MVVCLMLCLYLCLMAVSDVCVQWLCVEWLCLMAVSGVGVRLSVWMCAYVRCLCLMVVPDMFASHIVVVSLTPSLSRWRKAGAGVRAMTKLRAAAAKAVMAHNPNMTNPARSMNWRMIRRWGQIEEIQRPGIAEWSDALSPMEPVRFQASDGLTIHVAVSRG